jgi:carboxylesterase type B
MHFLKITLWLWFTVYWGEIQPARELPTVEIPSQGTIMATRITKFRTQRVLAYLGIPYAQAPVDSLRFAPPVIHDLPSWTGVRNSSIQPECWQSEEDYNSKRHEVLFAALLPKLEERVFDEDCLFLNIYVPDGEYSP